jgi:hypothetical protein
MKNLILPNENQVKIDIENFLELQGINKISIDYLPKYFKEIKEIILMEFSIQNIEFNRHDFSKIYNLYTQSDIFLTYLI